MASVKLTWRNGSAWLELREDLDTGFGDEHGVFELCCSASVGGDGSPVVLPDAVLPGTHGDHGFDREDHARFDGDVHAGFEIVRNLQVGVELLADAMANERADDVVLVREGMSFDSAADVGERATRNDGGDSEGQTFAGDLD